ncbi:hypothetical protein DFJ73DRAFT_176514 [Zopfochytrium polystomum]|nr:hypothetical protein DFJ73DRAFT_176514 [Zopfochytrium polystomum]
MARGKSSSLTPKTTTAATGPDAGADASADASSRRTSILTPARFLAFLATGMVGGLAAAELAKILSAYSVDLTCPASLQDYLAIQRTHNLTDGSRLSSPPPSSSSSDDFAAAVARLDAIDPSGAARFAVSPVHYLHTGLHPSFDAWNCFGTGFFRDVATGPAAEPAQIFALHTAAIYLAFTLLVAFERTRKSTTFPANSLAVLGTTGQNLGACLAVSVFWLIPWFSCYPTAATAPRPPRKNSAAAAAVKQPARPSPLADPAHLAAAAASVGLVSLAFALVGVRQILPYAFLPFQYLPALLPLVIAVATPLATLLFPTTNTTTTTTAASRRAAASRAAIGWYKLFQAALAVPDLLALATLAKLLLLDPSTTDPSATPPTTSLSTLLTARFADRASRDLPAWFLVVDAAALAASAFVWVAAELGADDAFRFLVAAVVLGPGSALMGAAAARERRIEELVAKEEVQEKGRGEDGVEGRARKKAL